MRPNLQRPAFFPLAVAFTAFGIGAIAAWLIASQQLHTVLTGQKDYVVKRISLEFQHRDKLIRDFAGTASRECSETLLADFRRALFEHDGVRDIAAVDVDTGEIRCTALLGELSRPAKLSPETGMATPTPDMSVWIDPEGLDYPGVKTFVVFRNGPVAVIVYPTWPGDLPPDRTWEVTATAPDGRTKITTLGQSGVSLDYQRTRWNPFTAFLHLRSCELENGIVCLYLQAGVRELITTEWPLLVTANLVNLTMAILIFLQLRTYLMNRNSVAGRVRRAVRTGGTQFRCVYQPIIDLRSSRLAGCEVLARFEDTHGLLSPAEFIPEIERQSLTWIFTEIVLARALKDLEKILEAHPELGISVNFFPADLDDTHVDRLCTSKPLRRAALRKLRLCCEILETGILDPDRMQKVHGFLDRCGFLIAIDDFGTGYSNIAQVRNGHIDIIKIDRSFVQELDRKLPAMRGNLVAPMIEIARSINVDVVAEGIETEAQLAQIMDLKVRYGQGYFLSKPLEIDDFREFVLADLKNAPSTVVRLKKS